MDKYHGGKISLYCLFLFIGTGAGIFGGETDDVTRGADFALPGTLDGYHVIYVGNHGDDSNPGTKEAPRKDLRAALESLKAGDALIILEGEYKIPGGSFPKKGMQYIGTPDKPILIRGEGKVKLYSGYKRGSAGYDFGKEEEKLQFVIPLEKCQYMLWDNLEFQGCEKFVLGAGSNHIYFHQIHFHDYCGVMAITWGANHITFEECNIHGGDIEHGIYLSANTQDVIVRGCEIWDTAINGIHCNAAENDRFLIENNIFHHNSREWGACLTLMGASHYVARNNIFYCNMGHIFMFCPKNDVKPPKNVTDVTIVNNTIFQPAEGRKGQVFVLETKPDRLIVKNNIFMTNTDLFDFKKGGVGFGADCVFDHNLYGLACSAQTKDAGIEKNGIFGVTAEFVKAPKLEESAGDFHLKAGSPGATGALLLKEICPLDRDGKERQDGGACGAYAEAAGK